MKQPRVPITTYITIDQHHWLQKRKSQGKSIADTIRTGLELVRAQEQSEEKDNEERN
jgi:hypothetical protein